MVSDWIGDYSGERSDSRDMGFLARWKMMLRNPPVNIFGYKIWACHGIPAIVTLGLTLVIGVTLFEVVSQFIKPVELTTIWVEPRKITVEQILAQKADDGALHLHKTGIWNRLCEVTSRQTFIDEQGGTSITVLPHHVDTPAHTGPFFDKPRPKGLQIPKMLSAAPGIWKIQIENTGVCWLLERAIPITGMSAEATFEIVDTEPAH